MEPDFPIQSNAEKMGIKEGKTGADVIDLIKIVSRVIAVRGVGVVVVELVSQPHPLLDVFQQEKPSRLPDLDCARCIRLHQLTEVDKQAYERNSGQHERSYSRKKRALAAWGVWQSVQTNPLSLAAPCSPWATRGSLWHTQQICPFGVFSKLGFDELCGR